MIGGLLLAYAVAHGTARAINRMLWPDDGIEDLLAFLRSVYPPPYRVREIDEAQLRRLNGWPALPRRGHTRTRLGGAGS